MVHLILNGFICLFILILSICVGELFLKNEISHHHNLCSNRCNRLLKRSMNFRKENLTHVENILKWSSKFIKNYNFLRTKNYAELAHICWKFFDYEYCKKHCHNSFISKKRMRQNNWYEFWLLRKMAWVADRFDSDLCNDLPQDQFCLQKHRNQIDKSCSNFQRRVVEMRLIGLQLEHKNGYNKFNRIKQLNKLRKSIEYEVCRLLDTQILCILSSGQDFCHQKRNNIQPQILNLSFIRENFLSILLPFGLVVDRNKKSLNESTVNLDMLLPEQLLDNCQKFNSDIQSNVNNNGERPQRALINENIYGEEGEEVTVAPNIRRLFSSEEDLEDMPPNFFYSTARLSKDFNTRYSILWGDDKDINRIRESAGEISTNDIVNNPQLSTIETIAGQKTQSDSMLTIAANPQLLALLKNGGSSNLSNAASSSFLMNDRQIASWPQETNKQQNKKMTNENVIEEYEEEWVYEDEINSSELVDDEEDLDEERISNVYTTPTLEISSSVESLIDGIESIRHNDQKQIVEHRQLFFSTGDNHFINDKDIGETNSEPMLHDTNIYFTKILEFDEEPEIQNKWPYEVEKTVAQYNSEENTQKMNNILMNSEYQENKNQEQHFYKNNDPFEILTADMNEYFTNKFPKEQEKMRHEPTEHHLSDNNQLYVANDKHQKILISTEPVPIKRSETLLVLLGVYLAFFVLAAFFLFCLVLAWLERRSRRHRSNLTDSEIKQRKSLFLYMNPKKGTMKYIA